MKALVQLFFISTAPLVVALSVLLYGGLDNTFFKEKLASAQVYEKASTYVTSQSTEDSSSGEFDEIFKSYLTPEFLQTKTELVIDDSYNWIIGKSQTPPALSFPEVKKDLVAKHPEIISEIEAMQEELKNMPTDQSSETGDDQMQNMNEASFSPVAFIKSDFSFPLEKQLRGVKSLYQMLRILYPVLIIFLVICLVLLFLLAKDIQARFRVIGSTLLISGVIGVITILFNRFLLTTVEQSPLASQNELSAVFFPIALAIIKEIFSIHTLFQGVVSGVFILFGTGAVVASFMIKKPSPAPAKPMKKNKK